MGQSQALTVTFLQAGPSLFTPGRVTVISTSARVEYNAAGCGGVQFSTQSATNASHQPPQRYCLSGAGPNLARNKEIRECLLRKSFCRGRVQRLLNALIHLARLPSCGDQRIQIFVHYLQFFCLLHAFSYCWSFAPRSCHPV